MNFADISRFEYQENHNKGEFFVIKDPRKKSQNPP